ncbi:MarR family winged helix-turn-helix transcriptional regulator [uncultured Veillonella sp.]|uniref:MarR family winged helix-turn-helix transcriptional regulator n=1 Tax=uncultured Veillonella sp. TaxID=159268 RepID=UPI002616AA81|nr:MarR family transcriptional regulator [uncultured Veillonella sp.]
MNDTTNRDDLALRNQLCFPLYACAKEIVRAYQTLLDPVNLTYTQYIVMMVMWEHKEMNVKSLGEYLYLDSGTLTPLLRKMETKGFLTRTRSKEDERTVIISLTKEGEALREKVAHVPTEMANIIEITEEEYQVMYKLLYKMLARLTGRAQKV